MSLRLLQSLGGPNVWAGCPVLEVALDLNEGGPWPAGQIGQTVDRLRAAFPDTPSGPADGAEGPLGRLAQAFAWAVLELQKLAGDPVRVTAVRPASRPGLFLAAVEFAKEPVARAAAAMAWRLLEAAREGRSLALAEELRGLRDLAYDSFPGHPLGGRGRASTWALCEAARARGIPVARLSPEYAGCVRLGQGARQHRCRASEPDTVSAVARMASTNKHMAKQLLQEAGIPVPQGRLVESAAEAWTAAGELGLPVAVKPVDSDIGAGVSLDLHTREQVEAAFRRAQEHSASVLVEHFAPGLEHRVLVVGDRVAAVTRIDPPLVVGDGVTDVADLVDRVNRDPRRGEDGSGAPLRRLKTDEVARAVLAAQGYTLDSVPRAGERVLLRRNPPYFKQGGTLVDQTDHIHPDTAALAVAAAQVLQIPVAGLDVVAVDISQPLEAQGGVVVEVNVSPGLWLHLALWVDHPRPVGEAIVALLFPPGHDGRIPVAALAGDATETARTHLAALLACAGRHPGIAGEREIIVGGRRWAAPAGTPQERAAVLLQNTTVDVALLETSPRELVSAGFGNDRCEVALLLGSRALRAPANGAADDGLGPPPGDHLQVLEHALGRQGVLVVSAEIEVRLPAAQTFLVVTRGDQPRVRPHLAAGGRALVLDGETVVLAEGTEVPRVLGKRPGGLTERETTALLAALAAGLVLGQEAETLTAWLGAFPAYRRIVAVADPAGRSVVPVPQ
jgi:cyanophycin synthetase